MRRPSLAATAALLPLILPLLLGACAMQPTPEIATPTPDLPEAFFFAPDAGAKTALDALMPANDPAYSALSDAALASAPSLAEAAARIDAARTGARRAGAGAADGRRFSGPAG